MDSSSSDKVVETVMVGSYVEMEAEEGKPAGFKSKVSKLFWHGGSAYDAWFSCASNQVAQVLLTLPYSFSQLGMLSGVGFQLFYGLMVLTSSASSTSSTEPGKKERKSISEPMLFSGSKFLMGSWENTGGTWAWLLIALFFSLALSFNSF